MTTRSGSDTVPLGPGVYDSLDRARASLLAAAEAATPGEQYAAAHVAALRTAAAVLAARTRPGPRRGSRRRPRSAWARLTTAAPELADWATFFAAGASKRAAAEAGLPSAATQQEADELLRQAERFLEVVQRSLHIPQAA